MLSEFRRKVLQLSKKKKKIVYVFFRKRDTDGSSTSILKVRMAIIYERRRPSSSTEMRISHARAVWTIDTFSIIHATINEFQWILSVI